MSPLATEIHPHSQLRGTPPLHDVSAPAGHHAPAGRAAGPPTAGTASSAGASSRTPDQSPGTFTGAALPICGVEVLIVVVHPWVLADIHEANLYVVAFHERFRRIIVLMAQGPDGAPCFYGPTNIVRVLHGLPFEMIPWRRLLYRTAPPPSWQLPIPQPRGRGKRTERAERADSSLVARGDRGVHSNRIGSADRTTAH